MCANSGAPAPSEQAAARRMEPPGLRMCDAAVTLGVATIMAAREVVVLVSGRAKREALGRLVDGPITSDLPASALRRHPACTILADADARPV